MERQRRRKFTSEYKSEVVDLVHSSGKGIGQIARDLDLTETSVRKWVQQAEIEEGKRPGLTRAEREELVRLRREVKVLREERIILKKAAAFFAKEACPEGTQASTGSSRRRRNSTGRVRSAGQPRSPAPPTTTGHRGRSVPVE